MKTYQLGTVGDRIVTVKTTAGEHVVTIRLKGDNKKSIEFPPKRQVFSSFVVDTFCSLNTVYLSVTIIQVF